MKNLRRRGVFRKRGVGVQGAGCGVRGAGRGLRIAGKKHRKNKNNNKRDDIKGKYIQKYNLNVRVNIQIKRSLNICISHENKIVHYTFDNRLTKGYYYRCKLLGL